MKKISVFLLFLFLTGSIVGCSKVNNSAPDASQSNSIKVVVKEEIVTIGKDTAYPVSGLLSIPQGAKTPYSAVVLIAGSGPEDMDETIYNNKPLKDIADYLVSKGIAVLRYDKCTYTYQTKIVGNFSDLTVEDEYIKDAVSASNLLKSDSRIDKNKVFIIGHSEGGMLAPRIDAECVDFTWIVIMEGSPRCFSDILYDQNMAIVNTLTGADKTKGQSQVDALVSEFSSLKTMSDADAKKITMVGASGYYYKEMDEHPASDYLTKDTKPILILQGQKDFQISPTNDFGAFQTLLKGKLNVTLKSYPNLNHLFMPSITGTVDEYKTASHVDEIVLNDVTNWILSK